MAAAKPRFKSAFNGYERLSIVFSEPTRTMQSSREECDINSILARYQKTGVIEHLNRYQGNYGNFLSASDYQSSLNSVLSADSAFQSLPSSLRFRFNNDPAQFLSFVENPANRDELVSMGLANKPIVEQPVEKNSPTASDSDT